MGNSYAETARRLQRAINEQAGRMGLPQIDVDGDIGPNTRARGRQVARRLGVLMRKRGLTKRARQVLLNPALRTRKEKKRADKRQKRRRRLPMRIKAYRVAHAYVGVMERGGNNVGPVVSDLIREGGGIPGQSWCGWFMAVCYKRAGSKAMGWQAGAVRLWLALSGVFRTRRPRKGDLVRFTFDHIGMFVKDNGNGTITTIEGNTGLTGAVSDSATGGEGVYVKVRSKSLVQDYLRVTR